MSAASWCETEPVCQLMRRWDAASPPSATTRELEHRGSCEYADGSQLLSHPPLPPPRLETPEPEIHIVTLTEEFEAT